MNHVALVNLLVSSKSEVPFFRRPLECGGVVVLPEIKPTRSHY